MKYESDGWNVLNKAKTGKYSGSIGRLGKGIWSEKKCYEEALKYDTKIGFKKGSQSAYNKSIRKGWFKQYTWLKESKKPDGYWTYDRLKEEASKYNSRNSFRLNSHSAYNISVKQKFLDEFYPKAA